MSRKFGKSLVAIVVVSVVVFACAVPAEAAFKMKLTPNFGAAVEVVDTGNTGQVAWNGTVGAFSVTMSIGLSTPIIGQPHIDWARTHLDTLVVSGGVGSLTIELTDTDFLLDSQVAGENPHTFSSDWGGDTDGTVTYKEYLDLKNREYANRFYPDGGFIIEHDLGSFSNTNGFSATMQSGVTLVNVDDPNTTSVDERLFSLTEVATITHTGPGQITSFDAASDVYVPEPTSFAIWALAAAGMAGGAGLARRKRNRGNRRWSEANRQAIYEVIHRR